MTIATQLVVRALLAAPGREMYGLEIMRATGIKSGTIYPILARLEAAGWIISRTENIDPHTAQRPARRYYQITEDGEAGARAALASTASLLASFGAGEDDAVERAWQQILYLASDGGLVASEEFFGVLRGLYRGPGALGT